MSMQVPGGALIPKLGQRWATQDRYLLRSDMTRVGREYDCDVVIADRAISRRHAELVWEGERLVVIPLSETNATLVNGRIVDRPTEVRLDDTVAFTDIRFAVSVYINPAPGSDSTQHQPEIDRRVSVVVSADVKSYSALMEKDDISTMRAMTSSRVLFDTLTCRHGGRVIDAVGDSMLIEFPNVSDALAAMAEVQQRVDETVIADGWDQRLIFRIGVDVGEIVTRPDGTVYGGAVNSAARIQSKAEPGRILVSQVARDLAVRLPYGCDFVDAGLHELKNIPGVHRLHALGRKSQAVAHEPLQRTVTDGDGPEPSPVAR